MVDCTWGTIILGDHHFGNPFVSLFGTGGSFLPWKQLSIISEAYQLTGPILYGM